VRVLDLSRMHPGAFCTSMLADLVAEVLKVEAPGRGDGLRFLTGEPFAAAHVALNRGKRSVTNKYRPTTRGRSPRFVARSTGRD
jgi:alpha-methylacyl-CoA racemase